MTTPWPRDGTLGSVTGWLICALAVSCACVAALAVALARSGRRHRAALGDRGWLLERERAAAAREAVGAERARIARELHDIVSHNVSLMVVQASAAREVPSEADSALRAIENAGRDTMTELRHLLGVLAPAADGADGDEPLAPQPGLDRLGELVDRIAFAGLPVEVRLSGEARPLPAGVSMTAYRIVQEALTNALKHASGGTAEVMIRYADRALRVEVLTSGSAAGADAPGAGRGIVGLRERVAVYGGSLDARRRLGGGYRVRARIPMEGS